MHRITLLVAIASVLCIIRKDLCLFQRPRDQPTLHAHKVVIATVPPRKNIYAALVLPTAAILLRIRVVQRGTEQQNAVPLEALRDGVHSSDVILNLLARRREPAAPITILAPDALRLRHDPTADCARYDSLRRGTHGTA